uniref:BHLH domain-containing protein n=1 Tax=Strigamia maritima TaxID=126957 RepID=T1IX20_STRMM
MPAEKPQLKVMEGTRRSSKPLMEKRRRARINHSLAELKNLVVDSTRKENTRYNKLEKADILEMAVNHLQNLQNQKSSVSSINKYLAGFSECLHQVSLCMDQLDGLNKDDRMHLLHHLTKCLSNIRTNEAWTPQPNDESKSTAADVHANTMGNDAFSNNSIFSGLPLIPSRLTTGEIAFVMPCATSNSNLVPFFNDFNKNPIDLAPNEQLERPKTDSEPVWRPW